MDEGVSAPLGEKGGHVGPSDLHLQGGRDAISSLELIVLRAERVLVQIDEARRDHEAAGIDEAGALERLRADARDPIPGQADVEHAVPAGLGIHDAAAADDDVEALGRARVGGHDHQG